MYWISFAVVFFDIKKMKSRMFERFYICLCTY